MIARSTFLLLLAVRGSALAATPLWSGDLETGDFTQWSSSLDVHPGTTDRLVVTGEPVREGRYGLKATVKYGDLIHNGARAELVTKLRFGEGEERWFHWYTLFPANFVTSRAWHVFSQWHSGDFGVPLGFNLHGETMSFRVMGHEYDQKRDWNGGYLWKAPLQRGHWNEFLLRVRFSGDPKSGFVQLWKDGEQVVPKTFHQTLHPGGTVYLKHGLYRDKSITWDQTVFHDGMKVYAQDPRSVPGDGDGGSDPGPPPPPVPGDGGFGEWDPEPIGCGAPSAALLLPLAGLGLRRRRS